MGFLGGLFDTGADEARRLNIENMDFIKSLFGGMGDIGGGSAFGIANQQYGLGIQEMQRGIGAATGGYDQAIAAAGGLGAGQERMAQRNLDRGLANVRSQMRSSGMGNTSAMAGAQFGAIEAGNQNLLNVQDYRSRTMSPLYAGRGQAQAQGLQNLAQYRGQYANQMMGGAGQLGSTMSQFQFSPGQSLFSQFAPILGMGLGLATGGAGFAAMGAMGGQYDGRYGQFDDYMQGYTG